MSVWLIPVAFLTIATLQDLSMVKMFASWCSKSVYTPKINCHFEALELNVFGVVAGLHCHWYCDWEEDKFFDQKSAVLDQDIQGQESIIIDVLCGCY